MTAPLKMVSDLVVMEPGARVERKGPKLIVTRESEIIARFPRKQIAAVFLGPGVNIARAALDCLRVQPVPILWVAEDGAPLSWLATCDAEDSALRLKQAASVLDPSTRDAMATAIEQAKLHGMAAAFGDAPPNLEITSPDRLRGIEGDASRTYFQGFWSRWPSDWRPARRSKHPPLDPANALLSLGYSLLSSWMTREIIVAGLDPGWGYVHTPHHGMAAMTQDLIEPFRSTFVDPWAVQLAASGTLDLEEFERAPNGCRIRDRQCVKEVIRSWLTRLDEPLSFVRILRARTARTALRAVVRELRAALVQGRVANFLVETVDVNGKCGRVVDVSSSSQPRVENTF